MRYRFQRLRERFIIGQIDRARHDDTLARDAGKVVRDMAHLLDVFCQRSVFGWGQPSCQLGLLRFMRGGPSQVHMRGIREKELKIRELQLDDRLGQREFCVGLVLGLLQVREQLLFQRLIALVVAGQLEDELEIIVKLIDAGDDTRQDGLIRRLRGRCFCFGFAPSLRAQQ